MINRAPRMASPAMRNGLPVPVEAGARQCGSRRGASGERDVDRRERMLVHAEGLAGDPLDAIAQHRRAERARCDREPQTRMRFMIGQDG